MLWWQRLVRLGRGPVNIPSANNFHVIHTAHCVDALHQKLMCEADMHVIPWHRPVDGKRISLAFDRVAQCHDFREVANFARMNQYKGIKLAEDSFGGHEVPYHSWTGYD
jgi:hypothetical protein